jgi:hypothetical protein
LSAGQLFEVEQGELLQWTAKQHNGRFINNIKNQTTLPQFMMTSDQCHE